MITQRIATIVIGTAMASQVWSAPKTTAKLRITLDFMQQNALDGTGKIDPSKLYFSMSPDMPMSGWIIATVYATAGGTDRIYVGSFSCNAGNVPAGAQHVIPGTACDMVPKVLGVPKGTQSLEADMYVTLTGNTETLKEIVASPIQFRGDSKE